MLFSMARLLLGKYKQTRAHVGNRIGSTSMQLLANNDDEHASISTVGKGEMFVCWNYRCLLSLIVDESDYRGRGEEEKAMASWPMQQRRGRKGLDRISSFLPSSFSPRLRIEYKYGQGKERRKRKGEWPLSYSFQCQSITIRIVLFSFDFTTRNVVWRQIQAMSFIV